MIHLSAFADEISPDLNEQITVLNSEHISFVDLRGVEGVNVLDFTDQQAQAIKREFDTRGVSVATIASPIGKVPIDSDFDQHMQRFERALQLARLFDTRLIRIFSFYALAEVTTSDLASWRVEVLRRLGLMVQRAEQENVILLHENEKDIYGDTVARCVDLLQTINHTNLRAVFDPANFIQCAQRPYPEAYEAIKPWLYYVHVKDAQADGTVVPAGQGVARWPDLLRRLRLDGYDGFLALEPHLMLAGAQAGFSGPNLFRRASQALKTLLHEMQWNYA
jgi:3-dehydroshikimate dehydratase